MLNNFYVVYRGKAESTQYVAPVSGPGINSAKAALDWFQEGCPDYVVLAVIDRELAAGLTSLQTELTRGLEEAAAALHDLAQPTETGGPRLLISRVEALLTKSRNLSLLNHGLPISVTYGDGESFEICPETGKVLTPASEMVDPYTNYERADIQEYLQWAFLAGLEYPTSINVCGLTFIHHSGFVEEYELDLREALIAERAEADRYNDHRVDRLTWEEDVLHAMQLSGLTRSDAQAITEGQQALFDRLYDRNVKQSIAAKEIVAAATVK